MPPGSAEAPLDEIRHFVRVVVAHHLGDWTPETFTTTIWGQGGTANEPLYALPTITDMRGLVRAYDSTEAGKLAYAFRERTLDVPGVKEVWFSDPDGDPVLSVVTTDFDLERDLQLQAILVGLHRHAEPAALLALEIYAEPEGVPDSARAGLRL